ncbi:hypothetical protein GALMADRAFT_1204000 [Galerina marginata CBS 339.88]|uniref:DUF6533 domain-containing protein n=1 Tax=Galerina marginata (strain CBS 339.88) TaxID=685588 RepID=A0A067SEK2_GALM3|nr:hypothetical protein GALMADRAFT_1204000 [Galerina marginata CBS 339.88]
MFLYNREYILSSNGLLAAATLLVADLLFTLDEEVNFVWLQPFTFGTFLFFLNRYLPFVDTLMGLYLTMSVTTPEMCERYHIAITWLIAVGLMVSELILLVRTLGLWNRKKWVFYLLGTMSTLTFGPGIAVTYLEVKSYKFGPVPLDGRGCNLESASKLIFVAYILIAISETVVVALTIKKGYEHMGNSKQSWVMRVYRHGLLFYIYLLVITIINIIVPLVASQPHYKNYLSVPQRVFHSIFCNRVILQINGQRVMHLHPSDQQSRAGSISKTNYTGNILDSGMQTGFSTRGNLDMFAEPEEDEHEMSTYHQDWTK